MSIYVAQFVDDLVEFTVNLSLLAIKNRFRFF